MMLQAVFRTSWICFLLFIIGACYPVKKGPLVSQPGYVGAGSGLGTGSYTRHGSRSGSSGSSMNAGIVEMIAAMMLLGPNHPSIQSHWAADQIPLSMIERRPVYPSSHVIHTNSGYQRVQDSQTDSKYTTDDAYYYVPVPGVPQDTQGTKF
uniref:Uncharacterized protein n=1 Tax=Kryptolebias marmoratus TaxID=37003 RepID=A0A3Q3FGK3_KRYMA